MKNKFNLAQLKAIIEGLLFLNGEDGIDLKQICTITNYSKKQVLSAIKELSIDFSNPNRGLKLVNFGTIYKFVTKPEHFEFYNKLIKIKPRNLSQAALETLGIIAYKQPISKPEIELIRGVNSDGILARLRDMGLVKELGRAETAGRPILYGVTTQFLDKFNLSSISDLPEAPILNDTAKPINLFTNETEETLQSLSKKSKTNAE